MDEIPMTFDAERDCWIAHTPSFVGEVVLHGIAQKAYRIQMDRLKSAPASATAEAKRAFKERADKLLTKPLQQHIMARGADIFKSTERVGKRIISLGAAHG